MVFMKKIIASVLALCMLITIVPVFNVLAADEAAKDFYLLDVRTMSARNKIAQMGLEVDSENTTEGCKFGAKMTCSSKASVSFDSITDVTDYTKLKFTAHSNLDGQVYIRLSSDNPETDKGDYYGAKLNIKTGWNDYEIELVKIKASGTPLGYDQISSIGITTSGYSMTNDLANMVITWGNIYLSADSSAASLKPTPTPTPEPVATASPVPDADIDKLNGSVALMINTSDAYAAGEIKKVDSENSAVTPVILNSRTLVPVRFISENFGAQIGWDGESRTVTVDADGKIIKLVIDSDKMTVDGSETTLDCPATILNDRTMIPLRALVEALGKNVFWDARGLILITPESLVIDAEKDFKTITAVIGLLKTGETKENYAAYPVFTQSILDEAAANIEPPYNAYDANALYYMLLAYRANPEVTASNGTKIEDVILKAVRGFITGGEEPAVCSGPYWYHAILASDFLLLKHTEGIYNKLTADETSRIDLLMKALAITGNWSYNDANNYLTGTDLMGNFKKTWNPNYRNTYLSIIWTASLYFGAEELDNIFTTFDYETYMAEFEKYGFVNIIEKWKPAGAELMENGGSCVLLGGQGASGQSAGDAGGEGKGVKIKFLYGGKNSSDPMYLFNNLVSYTYNGKNVKSSLGNPGTKSYSYIISGAFSPYYGMNGMMYEFSIEAGGGEVNRSSASYCYDSFQIINTLYANYKLLYGWDSSSEQMQALDDLIYVGTQDLFFKIENGYHGFSNGSGYDTYEHSLLGQGYAFVKDMWKKFHLMETGDTYIDYPKPAEPMGIATENAMKPSNAASPFAAESYYKLDKAYTGDVAAEFDLVFEDNISYQSFDGVIMYDSAEASGRNYSSTNALIQLKGGAIGIMNGNSYVSTGLKFNSNYRYHFKVKMNAAQRKWSVWITPVYPNAGEEVLVADSYSFRSSAEAIDNIGQLILVVNEANGSYRIENHTVTEG